MIGLLRLLLTAFLLAATATGVAQAAPFAYLPNSSSGTVSVIDIANGSTLATISVGGNPFGVAISPDGGKVFVTRLGSGEIAEIDTATNAVTPRNFGGSNLQGIALSPNGARLFFVDYPGEDLFIVDPSFGVASLKVGSGPIGVAVSPDGSRAYVANFVGDSVSVVNTATFSVVATVPVGDGPYLPAVSPDGQAVYVPNFGSGTVSVISTATNTVSATISVGSNPYAAVVAPDGARVYVSNYSSGTVSVINTATNAVTTTGAFFSGPVGLDISSDGGTLVVANALAGTVAPIDTATLAPARGPIAVGAFPLAIGKFLLAGFTVGGSVSGLGIGKTVTLLNNGVDELTVTADGAFTFTGLLNPGGAYAVTVKTQPAGQACTVTNGSGTATTSVTNVAVACADNFAPPGAPTGVSATAVAGTATVFFTAPAFNGGAAITSYTVSCTSSDGGTAGSATGAGSPISVSRLTVGKTYTCTVAATNSAGTGPASSATTPFIMQAPQPIPTLSEWTMILLAGLIGIVGFSSLRRRMF